MINHTHDPIESEAMVTPWKEFEFSYQIWHHVPNAFAIWLKEMWAFHSLTYFVRFFSDLIYFTYSWLKQAVLAYSFTSNNIIGLTEAKTWHWILAYDSKFQVSVSQKNTFKSKKSTLHTRNTTRHTSCHIIVLYIFKWNETLHTCQTYYF